MTRPSHVRRRRGGGRGQRAVIAKKKVLAPFGGRLGIRKVDLGNTLAPGSAIVPLEGVESDLRGFLAA